MNTLRNRHLNAYMTIEASLIIPLVIAVYFFLIFASFYLFNKTVLTQDTYIKSFRASIFTYWEDGYGEVSYNELQRRSAGQAKEYIESRSDFSRYPFFDLEDKKITALQLGILSSDIYVRVDVQGTVPSFFRKNYQLKINKISWITNPVANIRETRRKEKDAGNEVL